MKIRWTARSVRVQVPPPAPTSLCPRFEAEKTAGHHAPAPAAKDGTSLTLPNRRASVDVGLKNEGKLKTFARPCPTSSSKFSRRATGTTLSPRSRKLPGEFPAYSGRGAGDECPGAEPFFCRVQLSSFAPFCLLNTRIVGIAARSRRV